jgi:hypothetical protein
MLNKHEDISYQREKNHNNLNLILIRLQWLFNLVFNDDMLSKSMINQMKVILKVHYFLYIESENKTRQFIC